MCSRTSFPWLTELPICGVVKLCALKAGRRYTAGADRDMLRCWRPGIRALHRGSGALASLSRRDYGELSRSTQVVLAVGCESDGKHTSRQKKQARTLEIGLDSRSALLPYRNTTGR